MEKYMFLVTIADGKIAASDKSKLTLERREEKLQKLNLSPLVE